MPPRLAHLALLGCLALTLLAPSAKAIDLHRGVSLDTWETWPDDARLAEPGFLDVFPEWRRSIGMEKIVHLRESGFDFVRMPIDPFAFLSENGAPKAGHLLQQTLEAVAEIRNAGLKVVVDLHARPVSKSRSVGTETYLDNPEAFQNYLRLVRDLAKTLAATDPESVAFEVMNEPTYECDRPPPGQTARWPGQLRQLYEAARGPAPKLPIILSGACWGGGYGLARLGKDDVTPAMIADANVLWSFHNYEPFLVTHQGASWSEPPMPYVSGIVYPPVCESEAVQSVLLDRISKRIAESAPDAETLQSLTEAAATRLADYCLPGQAAKLLRRPFELADAWAEQMHIPAKRLFLGEFGMIRDDSPGTVTTREQRAVLMHDIRMEADERGIGWAVWSHGGSFGITLDDDSRKVDPLIAKALGLPGEGP